MMMIMMLTGKH